MTATEQSLADGLLHLLKTHPELLDEAPATEQGPATSRRTSDEVHPCLRCGGRARVAYIALTDSGPRWLDLCHPDAHWLRVNASSKEDS